MVVELDCVKLAEESFQFGEARESVFGEVKYHDFLRQDTNVVAQTLSPEHCNVSDGWLLRCFPSVLIFGAKCYRLFRVTDSIADRDYLRLQLDTKLVVVDVANKVPAIEVWLPTES